MTTYIMQQIRTTQIEGMLDTIPNTSFSNLCRLYSPEAYQSLNKFIILIYCVTPRTAGDIQVITYRVNCRQPLEGDAEKLADLYMIG